MAPRVTNINARGVSRRRAMGVVWLVVSLAAAAALVMSDTPRWWRLALVVPFGLAATGLLQAREKTCVFLAAMGRREGDDGAPTCPLPEPELGIARRQSVRIVLLSALIAVVATAGSWLLN